MLLTASRDWASSSLKGILPPLILKGQARLYGSWYLSSRFRY
ncbi:hypothetical protein NEICINOT_03065 [Neisseria cinerea ATCC 14685]|uniref:Uncharacterized protein n=1 Tax=Neisseria cinerea ATCC 14685 TaxID=546262 RepID=D0W099_NEICI|nr:hypothetical protein NEICINOT_03065 [Neisseria cinerea ATCC 14685]